MTRILFLSDLLLWPRPLIGGQLRVARIVEELAGYCSLTVVCAPLSTNAIPPMDWPGAPKFDSIVTVPMQRHAVSDDPLWGSARTMLRSLMPEDVPALIRSRVSTALVDHLERIPGTFSAIWASHSWTAEAARRARREPVFVDMGDFDSILLAQAMAQLGRYPRRLLHELQQKRLAAYEAGLPSRFAGAAVTRADDLALLDSGSRTRAVVIPNGVDFPTRVTRAPVAGRLLFVGSFGHPPNLEGMSWFCEHVLPLIRQSRRDVSVEIAGRAPVPEGWERIRREAGVSFVESPATLSDIYARASAVIAPIRIGHGTKLKVLEAVAYRAPLIATTEAVVGLPLVPLAHYLCADTPEQFASQCVKALNDPEAFSSMVEDAAVLVDQFSWQRLGKSAFDALKAIARSDVTRHDALRP